MVGGATCGRVCRGFAAAWLVLAGCGDDGGAGTGGASSTGATGMMTTSGEPTSTGGTTGVPTTDATTTDAPTTGGPTTEASATMAVTSDPTTGDATTTAATDTASSSGAGPVCGDGQIDPGEECDDAANNADDAACTAGCKTAVCGDTLVLQGVEGCDDGNLDDGDGCGADCQMESCGDGKVQGMEECDDGNPADDDACLSNCKAAVCGDSVVFTGTEACDDGNAVDTDECLATCVAAKCGDMVVWAGMEECDDGNASDADMCTGGCKTPTCMDTLQDAAETDVDCGGGVCPKCVVGKKCVVGSDCGSGQCTANVCTPPASCKQILAGDPAAKSGKYNVDLDGVGPLPAFDVFCDMSNSGGGWTVFYAASGADGEQAMVSDTEALVNNPLLFQAYNVSRARKVALSAIATETLFVRANNVWMKADKPAFDANLVVPNTTAKKAVTLVSSNNVMAPAFMGYANFNTTGGGDFGVSLSPDGLTSCNGMTVQGFDHHLATYRMLNCNCDRQYLYSYSNGAADGDAGYDVHNPLGAWTATNACHAAEGGTFGFYAAMR